MSSGSGAASFPKNATRNSRSLNSALSGGSIADGLSRLSVSQSSTAATLAGSLDYDSGVATLTHWVPGQSNSLVARSLLTALDGMRKSDVDLRVAQPILDKLAVEGPRMVRRQARDLAAFLR